MTVQEATTKRHDAERISIGERNATRRDPLLIISVLATFGATLIYLFPLPTLWYMSPAYGLLFSALGALQVGSAIAILARPTRPRMLIGAGAAFVVAVLWALSHAPSLLPMARILPDPDPWAPANSVIGFTGILCAGIEVIGSAGLVAACRAAACRSPVMRKPPVHPTTQLRGSAILGFTLLIAIVLLSSLVGAWGSSDGLAGAGIPPTAAPPEHLPAGRMSTVEYCRPDGVPLAMDLYVPARPARGAPVALYVHGGGGLGDRKIVGLGNDLANHYGALFTPLQQALNARGFVVASIDYRLPPGTPWPAPIEDAKCAVRFLRAHASGLGIDPNRIGVWGSSAGGSLAALLGLAGPAAGFDRGQYLDQSSAVQAVVDMFGPADFVNLGDLSPALRLAVQLTLGDSPETLRAASPEAYVAPGAPPFLILQGAEDTMVPPRQTAILAERLAEAGVPATRIEVQGAGHALATPTQRPAPEELVAAVADFFAARLK